MEYKPDIIISVHPLMQHIPLWVLKWQGLQKKVIFVTVITDLNSCHRTWWFLKTISIHNLNYFYSCYIISHLEKLCTGFTLGSIDVTAHLRRLLRELYKMALMSLKLEFMAYPLGLLLLERFSQRYISIDADM